MKQVFIMKPVFSMTNSGRPDCVYDKQHPKKAAYKFIKSMEQFDSKKHWLKILKEINVKTDQLKKIWSNCA